MTVSGKMAISVAILLTVPMLASAASRAALPYLERAEVQSKSVMELVVADDLNLAVEDLDSLGQKMKRLSLRNNGKRKLKEFIET
jgi:DNA-binding IclR family transcriptional regulator